MGHCLSSKAVKLATTSIWSVQVRDGGARLKGRLSPRETELLAQAHPILRLWLDRENIAYSKLEL